MGKNFISSAKHIGIKETKILHFIDLEEEKKLKKIFKTKLKTKKTFSAFRWARKKMDQSKMKK